MQQSASSPKSMRQRRILDVAAEQPNASVDELAGAVHSATPDLVERVLNEYGDPAPDADDAATPAGDGSADDTETDGGTPTGTVSAQSDMDVAPSDGAENDDADVTEIDELHDGTAQEGTATSGPPDADTSTDSGAASESDVVTPAQLTATERETLRAIQTNPEATQRALAEELGVSAATVSQRVNGIEGFEWSDRASFVDAVFDTDASETATMTADATGDDTTDESVAKTLRTVERQLETLVEQQGANHAFEDPELVSKVVHACMDAEHISEEEELAIIRTLLQ